MAELFGALLSFARYLLPIFQREILKRRLKIYKNKNSSTEETNTENVEQGRLPAAGGAIDRKKFPFIYIQADTCREIWNVARNGHSEKTN